MLDTSRGRLFARPQLSGHPLASGDNSEYRDLRCDRLEVLDRSILVYRNVRPSSGRAVQVGLQHGRSSLHRDLFQPDLLGTPVAKYGSAGCCLHVTNPRHLGSEHRDEVTLSIDSSHHQGKRDRTARATPPYLQRHEVIRGNPTSVRACPGSIENPRYCSRPVALVKPTLQSAVRHSKHHSLPEPRFRGPCARWLTSAAADVAQRVPIDLW